VHVVRKIDVLDSLETAQIGNPLYVPLCLFSSPPRERQADTPESAYRLPCTVWAEQLRRLIWTLDLGFALAAEYRKRFLRIHASEEVESIISLCSRRRLPSRSRGRSCGHSRERTPFALAMPEEYRGKNAQFPDAYRRYYLSI